MSNQGLTIAEAATSLGVSTRTIRRFIKAGKIKADLVPGQYGEEYRIHELPPELKGQEAPPDPPVQGSVNTIPQDGQSSANQPIDLIRELQDKNLALAAQLGAATERIRQLESQVKLLAAPVKPWWKRLMVWTK
jgi:MerR family copper efflux transcriptional regulator